MSDWIPWIAGAAIVWVAIVLIICIVVVAFIVRIFRDVRRDQSAVRDQHEEMRQRFGQRPGSRRRP